MSRRSFVYGTSRAIVALAGPLVPRWQREEWRETWEGELWHGSDRADGKTLRRSIGAVEEPECLVGVWRARAGQGLDNWSYPNYLDIRSGTPAFSGAVTFDTTAMTLRDGPTLQRSIVQLVSRDYFEVLGVDMAQGTGLDTGATSPSVVLSYGSWQRRYGGRPMLGETIKLNGVPLRVSGIAGADFMGLDRTVVPEAWAPLDLEVAFDLRGAMLPGRGTSWLLVVARLADGTSLEQARAAAAITTERLREMPHNAGLSLHLAPAGGLNPEDAGLAGRVLGMLMAIVALLLLIACANVANLLLARARTRTLEYGVRIAIGASRARLVRQLLIESLILSLTAAALGLIAARWCAGILMAMFETVYNADFSVVLAPDLRIIGFSAANATLGVGVFALAPAFRAAGQNSSSLVAGGGSGRPRRGFLANGLVVAQVALSVVVLVVAGLFVRSLQRAGAVDPGLDVDRLVVVRPLSLGEPSSEAKLAAGSWRMQLAERLRETASVQSVAWSDSIPLGAATGRRSIYTVPGDVETMRMIHARAVSPGYFRTTGIPVLAGRDFETADATDAGASARRLIINEVLANELWPDESALGKHLYYGDLAADSGL